MLEKIILCPMFVPIRQRSRQSKLSGDERSMIGCSRISQIFVVLMPNLHEVHSVLHILC